MHDDIVSATFGVYIRRATRAAHAHMATWVLVYALRAVTPGQPPDRRLVHRRRIYLDDRNTGRWHHFSFLAQVRRWIANPHTNHGLFVQATDSRGEPLAVIQPNSDDEQPYVSDLRSAFWATVCKTVRPILSDRCLSVSLFVLSCLSVTLVYCAKRLNGSR